jgi:hypothetical protein
MSRPRRAPPLARSDPVSHGNTRYEVHEVRSPSAAMSCSTAPTAPSAPCHALPRHAMLYRHALSRRTVASLFRTAQHLAGPAPLRPTSRGCRRRLVRTAACGRRPRHGDLGRCGGLGRGRGRGAERHRDRLPGASPPLTRILSLPILSPPISSLSFPSSPMHQARRHPLYHPTYPPHPPPPLQRRRTTRPGPGQHTRGTPPAPTLLPSRRADAGGPRQVGSGQAEVELVTCDRPGASPPPRRPPPRRCARTLAPARPGRVCGPCIGADGPGPGEPK